MVLLVTWWEAFGEIGSVALAERLFSTVLFGNNLLAILRKAAKPQPAHWLLELFLLLTSRDHYSSVALKTKACAQLRHMECSSVVRPLKQCICLEIPSGHEQYRDVHIAPHIYGMLWSTATYRVLRLRVVSRGEPARP